EVDLVDRLLGPRPATSGQDDGCRAHPGEGVPPGAEPSDGYHRPVDGQSPHAPALLIAPVVAGGGRGARRGSGHPGWPVRRSHRPGPPADTPAAARLASPL